MLTAQERKKSCKQNWCLLHDDNWSMDLQGLIDYGHIEWKFMVLVVLDKFSKNGVTFPLKNKKALIISDLFENIRTTSKRSPNSIETDDAKEVLKIFHSVPK